MERAVLEEVWRGGRSVSRERDTARLGQGCLKGSAGKSDCC